jgi:hypothetical protein
MNTEQLPQALAEILNVCGAAKDARLKRIRAICLRAMPRQDGD